MLCHSNQKSAYYIHCAFVALDSQNLGELVNDAFHHDFGDKIFKHYLPNRNSKSKEDKFESSDESSDDDSGETHMPKSILSYLMSNNK